MYMLRSDAEFLSGANFTADVHRRRSVLANSHDCKTRRYAVNVEQFGDFVGYFALYRSRDLFSA
jgi:hypothetical protein